MNNRRCKSDDPFHQPLTSIIAALQQFALALKAEHTSLRESIYRDLPGLIEDCVANRSTKLSGAQVRKMYKLKRKVVYDALNSGQLHGEKVESGGKSIWLIDQSDAAAWYKKHHSNRSIN